MSDWGFKIGLVWCLMTGEMGIAVLAIPIIFLYGLIGHFRWSQVLYGILGCVVWFYSLRYFGTIIYTFHDFFVWTIVLMIFGSIPASGKAYNRPSFGDNRFHLEYTADGTPYYYDSNRIMHILYDGGEGKTFSDSHGKRFNSDGWYIWRAD